MSTFVVIESTPGYMPEDDDPATFDDYDDAVAYLNERAQSYADDPDGNYRVEYGIASGDNLAACIVWDDDKMHDLGRVIEILRDDLDDDETTTDDDGADYRRRLAGGFDPAAGSEMLSARLMAAVAHL